MPEKPIKIMICDDSILVRRQMRKFLTALLPCEITEAANGQIAIENYKKEKTDIIFMDIVMPEKDGITTAKEILAYDSDACIIIASTVCTQSSLKEAMQAGVKDFLQKPVNLEDLKRVIEGVLKGDE